MVSGGSGSVTTTFYMVTGYMKDFSVFQLVLHDLLGPFETVIPKFGKTYARLIADALQALSPYQEEVEQGRFPDSESYH